MSDSENHDHSPAAMIKDLMHGLMADFRHTPHPSLVHGFAGPHLLIEQEGENTAYGYVMEGVATVRCGGRHHALEVPAGHYFSLPYTDTLRVDGPMHLKGFIATRVGYTGFRSMGGPVETVGRLKYIDGCSDSLLIGPPVKGDPCLNLLHFPGGIDQTKHTHPTIRAGLIHSGKGWCHTATGKEELSKGRMFILFPDAIHAFSTDPDSNMTLTVFHPDTDTGPWHDDHPMLNRTIVDGTSASKIDNIRTQDIRE